MMEGRRQKAEGRRQKAESRRQRERRWSLLSTAYCLLPSAFCLLSLLSGCGGVQSALNPMGPQAGRISRLWWLMLYVCTAVFIIVIISIFVAVLRSRKKQEKTSEAAHITPEPRSEQRMGRVVTAAVIATGVILFVFL